MATDLLFIGCGNMGGAMLAGWLASGVEPARFAVLDPALDSAPPGVALYRSPHEVPGDHKAVLLGFKPQQLGALAPGLQQLTGANVEVHYLLAGLTLEQIRARFPDAQSYVRVMPNLAARMNKSPVILAHYGLDQTARTQVQTLYDRLGTALWLEDETRFDLLTALAGSGPGFVYRFIDALAQAAVQLGADADQATALAIATVEGAASLAASAASTVDESVQASPAQLADRVASPGGMTREGLNVLDQDAALVDLLKRTLEATANKGTELSRANA